MDHHGRRNRKGRNHSRQSNVPFVGHFTPATKSWAPKSWPFCSGLYSFCIMTALMAIIYLMLEYHCSTCSSKCHMNSITRNIDDIAKNLSHINRNYHELEAQISKFSLELPKLEGQIEILEAIANTMEGKDFGWNPKTHLSLPNVDVYLSKIEEGQNVSCLASKHLPGITV